MAATSVPRLRAGADRAAAREDLATMRAAGSGPIAVIRRTPRLPMREPGRPDLHVSRHPSALRPTGAAR